MTPQGILFVLIVITIVVDALLVYKPDTLRTRNGKVMAFGGLFILPVIIGFTALEDHMEASKRTEYCVSCHVMAQYGKSLCIDDKEYIPAVHFQNHRVPHEMACFTCHTEYTLYGDYAAKIRGLRHIWYQYIAGVPSVIKLSSKYNNRECLHCHEGARSFEEQPIHNSSPGMKDSIKKNFVSCISSGCHDVTHDVKNVEKQTLWHPVAPSDQPLWNKIMEGASKPPTVCNTTEPSKTSAANEPVPAK